MIISPGRGYIFVHIPKTGGTSLAHALEERAMADDILIGDTPKAQRRKPRLQDLRPAGRLWKHSTLADIAGVVDPAAYFVFTLVRNPWDRIVSYYHWLQVQTFAHPAVELAQNLPFSDFLNHDVLRKSLVANPYARHVTDAGGVERCQLFARLEHVEEDLTPLWAHLGFSCAMPRLNVSVRDTDWCAYYTKDDADLVAALCAPDIERFGYSFDRT